MLPFVRVFSLLPLVLAAKIRREERRLVDWYRARGGLDSDRAVSVHPEGAVADWVHQRLIRAGAIRFAGERYYLDEDAYAAFRRRRRQRAWIVLGLLLIALAVAFYSTGDPSV
jgi:hypothetical protein